MGSRLVLHNSRKIHTSQSLLRGGKRTLLFEPAVNFQAARIWTVTVNRNSLGAQFLSYSVGFSFTWKTCTKCKVRLCCAFGSMNRGYFTHVTIPSFNKHVQKAICDQPRFRGIERWPCLHMKKSRYTSVKSTGCFKLLDLPLIPPHIRNTQFLIKIKNELLTLL